MSIAVRPGAAPRRRPSEGERFSARSARAASSPGGMAGPMICHSMTSVLCFDQSCFSPVRSLVNLPRVS